MGLKQIYRRYREEFSFMTSTPSCAKLELTAFRDRAIRDSDTDWKTIGQDVL